MVEALKSGVWRSAGSLAPRERHLCELADKLSRTPTRLVEADWAPLRQDGLDDEGCLELAHIVGIFNHLTRLADGLGLELDPATREASRTGQPLRRPEP